MEDKEMLLELEGEKIGENVITTFYVPLSRIIAYMDKFGYEIIITKKDEKKT